MPEAVSQTPGAGWRVVLILPLLAAWVALLVVPGLQPEWLVHSSLVSFVPLGFLALFAFPDRSLRTTRLLLAGIPAFLLGTAAAAFVIGWRARQAGLPGPSEVLAPSVAVALGVVIALAWRRGPFALLLLPFKLAFLALLTAGLLVALLLTQARREPAVAAAPPVTAEEQRQLRALVRDLDPWAIAPGEVRSVRLGQAEVDRLVAWLLPRLVRPEHARVAVGLEDVERIEARASLPVPLSRWLDITASGSVGVENGRLHLRRPRLQLGGLVAPQLLVDVLAPLLAAGISAERPMRPVLGAIRGVHVQGGDLHVLFGRVEASRGPIAELLWGPSP